MGMRHGWHGLAALGLAAALSTSGFAGDDLGIDLFQLPKPVQKTARAQIGDGNVVKIRKEAGNGKPVFAIDCEKGEKKWHLAISSDGTLLVRGEEITLAALPTRARQAVLERSRAGKVESLAKVIEDGQESYEAAIVIDGRERTLIFAADGELLDTLVPENPPEQKETPPPPKIPIPTGQPRSVIPRLPSPGSAP